MSADVTNKLVVGCGYLGQRVADLWRDAGCAVQVVTRSADRAVQLQNLGFTPIVADVTDPDSLVFGNAVHCVLFAVGFDRSAGPEIEDVYVRGLANVLNRLPPSVERIVYISSTGVYGDAKGEWVDEETECHPSRPGGKACLSAEELLMRSPFAARSIVLRLAGIYGPDRVPQRRALVEGTATAPALDSYLNLIHVDDAASCVVEAARRSQLSQLLLVSDGSPVVRREYYLEVLRQCGLDEALIENVRLSDSGRGKTNKRISNRRMIAELEVALRFPDYRVGLAHALGVR